MKITDLNQDMELNIFKCKNVKTPTKAWDAAGWDFYIPEDLHLTDFMKSTAAYLDDSIVYDEKFKYSLYKIPLIFTVSSSYSKVEVLLYLAWNFDKNIWKFKVGFYNESEAYEINDIRVHGLFDKDSIVTEIVMLPHASINIPSGIHMNLPDNVFMKVDNKSGISSKRRLVPLACVTAETIIETNKGKFTAQTLTKEFCDKNEILIKTYNYITKLYEFRKCDGFRIADEKDCIKIKFDDGSELEASKDHCIYDKELDGWYSIENL